MMKFYYYPVSTYSQKVLLALYEKQVSFEPYLVNILDQQEVEEFRRIYPLGKIPLLIVDNQHLIPESSIIIEYLDHHFDSGTRLFPAGNYDEIRQMHFLDRVADLYLNNSIVTLMFAKNRRTAEVDEAKRCLLYCYEQLNRRLQGNSWIMGERFTYVDCAIIPPLLYAERHMPFQEYGNLLAYFQRAQARASYQKVLADALPLLTAMGV
ncbi:glutathione S-transferase family protein [Thalassotalea litorea]|uniref:Glutathione S-transferase family protein n=1 Tax=Thalassotalea litorea TaxID=2020715 RepID=A0A5R9IMX2_9GAMM|nr:glutathione S-transferase family protein [Thalassotalea litorea]TLU64586.1 glutathione S-transferase family protein [Thalassotalea litorea]